METTPDQPQESWAPRAQSVRRKIECLVNKTHYDKPPAVSRHMMHLAALLAVPIAVCLVYANWSRWVKPAVESPSAERIGRYYVSARGGSRMATEDFLVQPAIVRTAFGERETPVAAALDIPEATPTEASFAEPTPSATAVMTRTAVITYVVQAGDIVGTIAQRFGISEDTICWANNLEGNPDLLRIGQVLTILPVSGVLHVVAKGDTLESIAAKYKAKVEDIVAFPGNGLGDPPILVEGQQLIVPNGTKPYVPRVIVAWSGSVPKGAKTGSGSFVWPTTGLLTQRFSAQHIGIDIAWKEGTPVLASDSGYVAQIGNSPNSYGRFVLIDHSNGFQTLYAHLKTLYVQEGQSVAKGEKIGLMGDTGRSTGPHLHFEIKKNGVHVNPLNYLPQR